MLATEDTSLLEILNSVRHQTAIDLLETTNAPLKFIAKHLGYSNASNFIRAFKISTGKTPAQVRAKT